MASNAGEDRPPFRCEVELVRTDAAWLQQGLTELLGAAEPETLRQNPNGYSNALAEAKQRFEVKQNFASRAEQLCGEFDSSLGEEDAHYIGTLANAARDATRHWSNQTENENDVLAAAARASADLDQVVDAGAWLTIPAEVRDALLRLRIGRPLDFHQRFEKTLPKPETRQRLLDELAARPLDLPGVVDPKNGVIYRISPSRFIRAGTAALPLVLTLFVAGALLLGDWLVNDHKGRQLSDRQSLLVTFLAVVAGAIVHLTVEKAKTQSVFGRPKIYVPGDALIWAHLRWASISLTLIPLLVVWTGLRAAHQGDLITYLFGGYSADSLSGLFLSRFASRAAAKLPELRPPGEEAAGLATAEKKNAANSPA